MLQVENSTPNLMQQITVKHKRPKNIVENYLQAMCMKCTWNVSKFDV
jgi:hypothetical protein